MHDSIFRCVWSCVLTSAQSVWIILHNEKKRIDISCVWVARSLKIRLPKLKHLLHHIDAASPLGVVFRRISTTEYSKYSENPLESHAIYGFNWFLFQIKHRFLSLVLSDPVFHPHISTTWIKKVLGCYKFYFYYHADMVLAI